MNDQLYIVGAFFFMVALSVFSVVSGIVKKRGKYTLKKTLNGLRPFVSLIWVAYFMVLSVSGVPWITDLTTRALAGLVKGSASYLVISFMPSAYVLTTFYVVGRTLFFSWKPWVEYTEKEKALLKEDKEKTDKNLRRLLFWKKK